MDTAFLVGLGRGRLAITGATTIAGAHLGLTVDATSGTFALGLSAVATLNLGGTGGFHFIAFNSGSGTVTVTANGAEVIRSPTGTATTYALTQGQGIVLCTTATGWEIVSGIGIGVAPSTLTIVYDNAFIIEDESDTSKRLVFSVGPSGAGFTTTISVGVQTGSRTFTLPVTAGNDTFAVLGTAQTFSALNTYSAGLTATGGTILGKPASTAGIQLDPNAATGNFTGSLSPANLTANRRWTFPDADGVPAISASALTTNRPAITTTGGLLTTYANALFDGTTWVFGTASADVFATGAAITPAVQVNGTGAPAGTMSVTRWSNGTTGPRIVIGKSRGASVGTQGLLTNGDDIGGLVWNGSDGAQMQDAATILAQADAVWAAGSCGTRLVFFTTPTGSVTRAESFRIAQDQSVTFLGNLAQTGAKTFSTGTGAFTHNGSVSIVTGKTLTIADLTSGRIPFVSTSGLIKDNANLTWDESNSRLGMTSSTASIRFGGTDVGTSGDIDFPNVSTGSATVRIFRSTNTAGAVSVIIYKGDNTATAGHTFTSLGNYTHVGNYSQTGTGTWSNASGVASLNGDTNVASGKHLYAGSAAAINTDEVFQALKSTSATAAVTPGIVWGANSTGTAAAGFGVSELVTLESTTTNNTSAYSVEVSWATATHASRKAQVNYKVFDTAARTAITLDTDGAAAVVTFPSANPIKVGSATMIQSTVAFTNGAAAQAGTLLNAPTAGNPTKWIPINDNGTTRYLPAW